MLKKGRKNEEIFKKSCHVGVVAAVLVLVAAAVVSGGASLAAAGLLATVYGCNAQSIYYLIDSYNWGKKAQTYYDAAKLSAV